MDSVAECPCRRFQSPEGLFEALKHGSDVNGSSIDEFRELLHWISTGLHEQQQQHETPHSGDVSSRKQTFSCTPTNGRCRSRVECSIMVLNGVRQAFRPFLEDRDQQVSTTTSVNSKGTKGTKSPNNKKSPEKSVNISSQADFPSLGIPTKPSVPQKTKKERKRIRPAIITSLPSTSWSQGKQGNLVNVVSVEEPTAIDFMKLQNTKGNLQTVSTSESAVEKPHCPQHEQEPIKGPTESQEVLTKDVVLNNLATLYSLLVDSCLVPSSFDEVHLLLAALSCKKDSTKCLFYNDDTTFGETLRSTGRCRFFATKVLQKQRSLLVHMVSFVPKLAECTLLKDAMPDLMIELSEALERRQLQRSTEPTRLSSRHSALLTLPFQAARDSRHNFKKPHQQRAYKNREETRDAFLYQLRTFLNVRGKIVDDNQSQIAIEKIKDSANGIVADVDASNLPWFAEFFTDMLIQLGNVPIQETDSEVLKIADQEKLRALHRRFSTKTGSKKSATQKLSASQKNDESPFNAAQRYFTHHQEFFYLFVTSANSYTFTVHFRAVLVRLARQQLHGALTIGLDALCLLGRFLGVIIFSSNWKQHLDDPNEVLQHDYALDGLHLLGSCGILLPNLMKSPTPQNIFFAIEIVAMAKWDFRVHLSPSYHQTLRILRNIQQQTCLHKRNPSYFNIELLFWKFCGLELGASMTDDVPGDIVEEPGSQLWTHLESRVEELQSFIAYSTEKIGVGTPRNSSTAKKLRPSTIEKDRAAQAANGTATKADSEFLPCKGDDTLLSKLGDSFFHQNAGLKSICEFSINQTLCYVESHLHAECFKEFDAQGTATLEQLTHLHITLSKIAFDFLSNALNNHTRGVLVALCPSLDATVVDVAVSLSNSAGASSGASMLSRLVTQEIERRREAITKATKKSCVTPSAKEEHSREAMRQVPALSTLLLQVASILQNEHKESTTRTAREVLISVRAIVDKAPTLENQCTKESDIKNLFAAVYMFLGQLRVMGRVMADADPTVPNPCTLETFLTCSLIAVALVAFSQQTNQILRGLFVPIFIEKVREMATSIDMGPLFDELHVLLGSTHLLKA